MIELIVALDGPDPFSLACKLYTEDLPCWFKIGPQAMAHPDWTNLIRIPSLWGRSVFLDLKLYDTADTVRETVKGCAATGVAAISTWTNDVTEVALDAAKGTTLRIWQLLCLSDSDRRSPISWHKGAHGLICPPFLLLDGYRDRAQDLVVPGVRLFDEDQHGHTSVATPSAVRHYGGTHAVVGRPIWQAANPVDAARRYAGALT